MREVAVIGAGMIKFGKMPDYPAAKMGGDAARMAVEQAGINPTRLEATYCGNIASPPNIGQRVNGELGVSGIPAFNHENACASSSAALRQGFMAVGNGDHDYVLVVGVENLSALIQMGAMAGGPLVLPHGANLAADNGMLMPAGFAIIANRHMYDYGTTKEQLAKIAVKNHRNSSINPYAHYHKIFTIEEILESRMVCDPITLLQCCPIGDGAAAVVLASAKKAKQHTTKPVFVKGSVLTSGKYKASVGGAVQIAACVSAAKECYEMAGVSPEDVDVVELHDCFTPHELVAYEDLGFCPKGEGGRFIEEGLSDYGGQVVVNPSGGLLSKGHPIGATGVAQVVEIVWQLQGITGKRQVEGARVGLTHNGGGFGPGNEPGAMSISILTN
jgi:benzoylsuccinyl-CoA thiolase BbsB subunit